MKKILFICLICLSICFNVSAKTEVDFDYELMMSKLSAFEIIDAGNIDYTDIVTRGEFAEILVKMMGMNELAESDYLSGVFSDVESNSPHASYINLLCDFGIINGYKGAKFHPNEPITSEQAYKMLLVALGYRDVAEKNGGYPTGYMTSAMQTGISKDVTSKTGETLSMGMVIKMLDNALDTPMLIENPLGSGIYEKDKNSTFFNNMLASRKLVEKKGTITGNQYGSFLTVNEIDNGQIEIDGNVYATSFTDIYKLIGCRVTYFVENISSSGLPVVYFAEPERTSMDVLEIKSDDIVSANMNNVRYYNEKEKIENVNLNTGVKLIYNGRPVLSPTSLDLLPVNGQIQLIDNNRDKKFDILFVTSCEYFTVDRISERNQAIFLKDGNLFGLRTITMDFTDEDFKGNITYDNGEPASIGDIMEGDVISVYHGLDKNQIDIKILREKQEAVLKELDMSSTELNLDGNLYTLAKRSNGEEILPETGLVLGKKYSFIVGEFGEIAYMEEVKSQNMQYGYILDSESRRGSREVSYLLVTENKEIEVYCVADRVMFNNKKMNKEKLPLLRDCLIKFEVDENNNICKIEESVAYGENEEKQFNEETAIFSALNYGEPIFSSEETVVFLIPDSREEEDFQATIKLKDKDKYLIQAYDKDSTTNAAGAILVYMNVFYDTPGFINAESPIAVLHSARYVYDEEEDEYVLSLNILSEGEKKSISVKNSPELYNIVEKMCIADVFQYSLNSLGEIDNILTLAEFVPMPNLYHTGMMSSNEMIFGMAYDEMGGILAKGTKTSFVNYLTLKTDLQSDDTKSFLLSTSDEIYYYIYDSEEQQVDLASFDDIKSSISFGEADASKVFIYSSDNEPKIVLIVQ